MVLSRFETASPFQRQSDPGLSVRTDSRFDLSLISALTVLCLMMGFSLLVMFEQSQPEPGSARFIEQAHFHETDRQKPELSLPVDARPITMPYGKCCEHAYAVFYIPLTAADRAHPEPALLIERVRNNAAIYLDGEWVAGSGRMYPRVDNYAQVPRLFRLPPETMASAEYLQIVVARNTGRKHVYPVWLGEHDAMIPLHQRMSLLARHLPLVFGTIGLFVALLCAAAAPLYPRRRLLYSVALLFAGWSGLLLVQQTVTAPLSPRLLTALYYTFFWITLSAATVFVLDWTDGGAPETPVRRKIIPAIWGVAILAAIISFCLAFWWGGRGATKANIAVTWTALLLIPALGVKLFLFYRNQPRAAWIEMLAFAIIIVAVVIDMAMVRFFDREGILQPAASLFFPFALLLSLARRGRGVFDLALATNEQLQSDIAAAEARVIESQKQLRDQEKRATLDRERARIMRDIHDGFGGELVSLLSTMNQPGSELTQRDVKEQVQRALDDLRLMIDSLDGMGTSLDIALALFQERARSRLAAVGIEFTFDNQLDEPSEGYTPAAILNIYRILQEGLTNILKHAEAQAVSLTVMRETAGTYIIITLRDDGRGMSDVEMIGRGRLSMQRRAESLNAELKIENVEPGTRLTLRVEESA